MSKSNDVAEASIVEDCFIRTDVIGGLLTDKEIDQLFLEIERAKYKGAFKRKRKANEEMKRLEKSHWHEQTIKRNKGGFDREKQINQTKLDKKPEPILDYFSRKEK